MTAMPFFGPSARGPAESIAGAAIRYADLGTFGLPLPATHEQIMGIVERQHGSRTGKHQGEQGFITRSGRFVNGRQALIIARRARQLRRTPLRGHDLTLDYLLRPDQMPEYAGAARPRGDNQMVSADHLGRHLLYHCLISMVGVGLLAILLFAPAAAVIASSLAAPAPGTIVAMAIASGLMVGLGLGTVVDARGARWRLPAILAAASGLLCAALWALAVSAGLELAACAAALVAGLILPLVSLLFLQVRVIAALLSIPFLAVTEAALFATFSLYA